MSSSWVPHWDGPKQKSAEHAEVRTAGQDSAELTLPVSADVVLEALREVEDPELGISIVELGLIYGIQVEEKRVRVSMTLTSPGCPIGPMLQTAVHGAVVRTYPNLDDVKVDIVWNPPWDPYKMASEEAKDMLGIW